MKTCNKCGARLQPPFPHQCDPTFEDKEARAGELYRLYLENGNGDPEDCQSTIVDMVTDLLIFGRSLDLDAHYIIETAIGHYETEEAEHLEELEEAPAYRPSEGLGVCLECGEINCTCMATPANPTLEEFTR